MSLSERLSRVREGASTRKSEECLGSFLSCLIVALFAIAVGLTGGLGAAISEMIM